MWSGHWYGGGVLANSAYGVSLQFSGNFGFLSSRQHVRGFISSTMLLAAPAAPSLVTAAISRGDRAFAISFDICDGYLIGMKSPITGAANVTRPEDKQSGIGKRPKCASEAVIVRHTVTLTNVETACYRTLRLRHRDEAKRCCPYRCQFVMPAFAAVRS